MEQDFAYRFILLHSTALGLQSPDELIITDINGNRVVQAAVNE